MEQNLVVHQTINGKYRVVIERAASTKGILGYKVEANGDDLHQVVIDAHELKAQVETIAVEPDPIVEKAKEMEHQVRTLKE